MGSLVNLGIERLELDWGKNEFFRDHSALFLPTDIRPAPYYYADNVIEEKAAYVRPLKDMVRRLEMLGYTLEHCAERYRNAIDAVPSYYPPVTFLFEQFADVLLNVDFANVELHEGGDYELGELAQVILRTAEFAKTAGALSALTRDDGTFFENLDPYVALRLLAENPSNLDRDVVWRTADILEGGYVKEADLYQGVPEEQRCLVVTEGSSDGHVLRKALPVVAPDVADFFDFVDMTERYPFTGAGNVVRFCEGLARIRIQNRVLVVLDNDTTGRQAFRKISSLKLPPRMKATVLPDIEQCNAVQTVGPSGMQRENVNGRAVAIECFLDIWRSGLPPTFRWTSYDAAADAYQGELLKKDDFVRAFMGAEDQSHYDYGALDALWRYLIKSAASVPALE